MLPETRLFIAAPEPGSLQALRNLRRLIDGPWTGRCEWSVVDTLATSGPGVHLPHVPALARVEDGTVFWYGGDPAAGIPSTWLFEVPAAGESGVCSPLAQRSEPPDSVPAPVTWREVVDLAPVGAALFLDDLLVYANPGFARHYHCELPRLLGRRPQEWGSPSPVDTLAAALDGTLESPGGAPSLVVRRLAGVQPLPVQAVFLSAGGGADVLPLLSQVRTINHAIGNALVGILGYGELLEQTIPSENSAAHNRLQMIAAAARRVDELSREISRAIRSYLGLPGTSQ